MVQTFLGSQGSAKNQFLVNMSGVGREYEHYQKPTLAELSVVLNCSRFHLHVYYLLTPRPPLSVLWGGEPAGREGV
jgi:hypothetical protein